MIEEGILNIYKEKGMTSHDVVQKVRRIAKNRRVGHTGTLDPMATGVLPVCIGRATRVIEYFDVDFKTYECTLKLGMRTDSADVWGNVITESTPEQVNEITEDMVSSAFSKFKGLITQTPPIYSAIRVDGKRLYEYARAGETVEIPSRQVFIKELRIDSMELGNGLESKISFSVTCSKGTYIRSICDDVGEFLGVHACMASLTRTCTGAFDIKDAVKLSELEAMDESEITKFLTPSEKTLKHFGIITLSPENIKKFRNGLTVLSYKCNFITKTNAEIFDIGIGIRDSYRDMYCVYEENDKSESKLGEFAGIALLTENGKMIKPEKVFV